MPEIRTIELSPPQPCGVLDQATGQICGRPALRATVEAAPRACAGAAGYLLVLPVCPACARGSGDALAGTGAVPQFVAVLTTTIAIPDDAPPGMYLHIARYLDDQAGRFQRDAIVLRERAGEIAARS